MSDKIQSAYRTSKDIYDSVLTQSTWWAKLYIHLFWGGVDDVVVAERLLSYLPADFAGKLLDVPVGTAAFTWKKYIGLPNTSITCLDYSTDMLHQAKERLNQLSNITFLQGDVGKLPFEEEQFDTVLSMNGFHAFPDKERAFSEIYRVLKKGGSFLACFYIEGESKRTDFLVRSVLSKKGWFTPPFETKHSLEARLKEMYHTVELSVEGSIAWFRCIKSE